MIRYFHQIVFLDAHTHILSLPDDQSAAFFGVYDGHGGLLR